LGTLPERETEYGTIRLWASAGWAVTTIALGAWFEHAAAQWRESFARGRATAFSFLNLRVVRRGVVVRHWRHDRRCCLLLKDRERRWAMLGEK